jgi:hypothetical protein
MSQDARETSAADPYLYKEHPEGKIGEKISVPVRFSRVDQASRTTEGR